MARIMTRLTGNVALISSLPVEVLMKSVPAIIATMQRAIDIAQAFEITGAEDAFKMGWTASAANGDDLFIKRLPLLVENMRAGDDHVDLARTFSDSVTNFLQSR